MCKAPMITESRPPAKTRLPPVFERNSIRTPTSTSTPETKSASNKADTGTWKLCVDRVASAPEISPANAAQMVMRPLRNATSLAASLRESSSRRPRIRLLSLKGPEWGLRYALILFFDEFLGGFSGKNKQTA